MQHIAAFLEHLIEDEFLLAGAARTVDDSECIDRLEKAGLDGVDQVFAVGEEGVETGIFGLAPTEGEDVGGLGLEPFVETGVCELKVFLDVCLWN